MKVSLLYFGQGVGIPHTSLSLGIGMISVWIDDAGFTSATNDLGATGYVYLSIETVDIGNPDADTAAAFQNLHGQVVKFDITPSTFFRSGGIARIALTRSIQTGGGLQDRKIEFIASNINGLSFISNTVSFSVEMLQLPSEVADISDAIDDDAIAAIENAAPPTVGMA